MNISEIHPKIFSILSKRGWNETNLHHFFSANLTDLPNLLQMNDLEKAALRIIQAIKEKKKIAIYGDYDADGSTSCALLFHFFKLLDYTVQIYQPSRFVEGYGIHPSSIDQAIEDGIDVMITVDCGISNNQTALYAKERNFCLIITDHHQDASAQLPDAFAIVNPNRRDEPADSELKPLAGVGVAFCLALQIKKIWEQENSCSIPSIYSLLQFVAIGTIADLAFLTPTNLKLVRHGLKQLPCSHYPGIKCFLSEDERLLPTVSSEKIAFQIGPMINSRGRLEHPELSVQLLCATQSELAYNYLYQLEENNFLRKKIQEEVFNEAFEQIKNNLSTENINACIAYSPDWHEGVIGIVASKLVGTFHVPSLVFTNASEEGVIKASARTAGNMNLFEELSKHSDLFLKFGGHKSAAGLSMPRENFELFKERFISELNKIPLILRSNQSLYDEELKLSDINISLVKSIEMMEPFGMGNSKPIFKINDLELDSYTILKEKHIRWIFKSSGSAQKIQAISFNYIDAWNSIAPDFLFQNQKQNIEILCTVGVNRFRGNESIQLMVQKITLE